MGVETPDHASPSASRPAVAAQRGPAPRRPRWELIGRYLAPEAVAGMVLDAVRRGRALRHHPRRGLGRCGVRFERMQQSMLARRKA